MAAASLIAPFALGYGIGQISAPLLSPGAHPVASALFIATAFSITALPILGRIMMEFDMTRTPIGVIAISAAAINDVIGWLLLALITTLTLSNFDAASFALKVVLVLVFFAAELVRRAPADEAHPASLRCRQRRTVATTCWASCWRPFSCRR